MKRGFYKIVGREKSHFDTGVIAMEFTIALHTGISDQISIQALVVQIQGSNRCQMKKKSSRY